MKTIHHEFTHILNQTKDYPADFQLITGSLSLTDDGQFTISWNKNRFYPMFNFAPTNPRLLNCTGALLITLYTDEGGTVMASLVDDAEWMTNGSMQFLNLKSLNRKTRL